MGSMQLLQEERAQWYLWGAMKTPLWRNINGKYNNIFLSYIIIVNISII